MMNHRLSDRREHFGMNRNMLRLWGILFLTLGLLSRGILQTRVLGIGGSGKLLEVLNQSGAMTAAAVALALEAVESCAVPIFAVLLVEGFQKTRSFRSYSLRMLAVAVVSELPYHFAVSGSLLDFSSRNPVFANVVCLLALYLYRHYAGLRFPNILIKLLVFAAGIFWAMLLRITYGVSMLLVVTALWALRDRRTLRNLMGAAVAICCCVGRPLAMFSPFGFLLVHFYNGEEGTANRLLSYALYPLIAVLVGFAGMLLF